MTHRPLIEIKQWLQSEGLIHDELWSEEEREKIIKHFDAEDWHTGGGCMVIVIPEPDNGVIGITEECICFYPKKEGDECIEDTFFDNEETEILDLLGDR